MAGRHIRRRNAAEDFEALTVSIGVAEYRLGEPLTVLIDRSDAALYRAKSDGRNRAVAETALQKSRPPKHARSKPGARDH
jgi:diguanylate cyclase